MKGDTISIEWGIEDVYDRAEDRGLRALDSNEAREVLRLCKSEHDCNVGINWDVIDYWTNHVLREGIKCQKS